jgi:hypothetical protein
VVRLVARVAHITLNDEHDRFSWGLLPSGIFSLSSMDKALITDSRVRFNLVLWKLKIPLRIKKINWYLIRGAVLTKDNLIRWNQSSNKLCILFTTRDNSTRIL